MEAQVTSTVPCQHPNTWFDRTLCPEPCGLMHYVCEDCGRIAGNCAHGQAAKPDILDQRGRSYGPVIHGGNISRIAALWTAYLGVEVTEHDVGWMMTLLKASRSRQDPANDDNYTDARGYIDIAQALSR